MNKEELKQKFERECDRVQVVDTYKNGKVKSFSYRRMTIEEQWSWIERNILSELASNIEKIKAEFSDNIINDLTRSPDVKSGMIEMRDKILNRLK